MQSSTEKTTFLLELDVLHHFVYSIHPSVSSIENLFTTIDDYLTAFKFGNGIKNSLKLICEEVFLNIVNYSTTKENIDFLLGHTSSGIILQFVDQGISFNPCTDSLSPSAESNIDEIKIGGFGISIIKKLSSEIVYERKNDKNFLCIIVNLED